jgi:hypothetical protein
MNAEVADAHRGINSQCNKTGTITNPAPIPKNPDRNPAPKPPAYTRKNLVIGVKYLSMGK